MHCRSVAITIENLTQRAFTLIPRCEHQVSRYSGSTSRLTLEKGYDVGRTLLHDITQQFASFDGQECPSYGRIQLEPSFSAL